MMVSGHLRWLLRAEGLALFAGGLVAYHLLGQSWWLFLVLFLAPDLSFAAYLAGPKAGAIGYNVLHSTVGPIVLAGFGWWFGSGLALGLAVIWLTHAGFDRMLGYGLKYASGFHDTHLGRIGKV